MALNTLQLVMEIWKKGAQNGFETYVIMPKVVA